MEGKGAYLPQSMPDVELSILSTILGIASCPAWRGRSVGREEGATRTRMIWITTKPNPVRDHSPSAISPDYP